jgi:hypothetical protein
MERNWCCPEFQSHATNVERKVGFRVALVWKSRRPFPCLLEFRSEGKEPSDFSDGGMEIKFCPWCGTNLNDINSLGMILRSARGAIGETEVTCDEQNVAIFTLPNEYGAC